MIIDLSQQREFSKWTGNNGFIATKSVNTYLAFHHNEPMLANEVYQESKGNYKGVYRKLKPLPQQVKHVVIDVTGDGHTYHLRLFGKVNEHCLTYEHSFDTTKNKRQRIHFRLADFTASLHGFHLTNARILKPQSITGTGFISKKSSAESFALSVFSLSFF